MIHHRTKAEVRRFDIFKIVVTLVLAALLIWQLLAGRSADTRTETAVTDTTAAATETKTEPEMADTGAEEAEPVAVEPIAPTFQLPGGELQPGEFNLAGKGAPGSTIEVMIDGEAVGTTTVDADGRWELPVMLAAGAGSLSVRSLDADGMETAVSDPAPLNIAPTMPAFDLPEDFAAGGFDWHGKADPGAVIDLLVDGEVVGQAAADADGNWSFPIELAGGDYQLSARLLDADGNVVMESEPTAVSIPAAFVMPEMTLPDMGADNPFPLSGTGQPGSDVDILVDGEVVGTAVVGDDGRWSFDYELGPGEHEIGLQTMDAGGNALQVEPFSFTMPEMAAAAPSITSPASGDELASGEVAFSGTGQPGSEVEILDNGVVVGTAVVGDDGSWSFNFTPEAGEHEFIARDVGSETGSEPIQAAVAAAESETAAEAETTGGETFSCGEGRPGIDQGDTYIVGDCDYLAKIANQTGVNLQDLIAANPQIEDPNLIFPEQVINMPPR